MNVSVSFGSVNHSLPARWLGTKFFGIGSASQAMTTADSKTLATLLAESGLQFASWHELTQSWGTTVSPASRTLDWIWIVDAMTAAGRGWALQVMAGPLGVGRTSGDPASLPQVTSGNYPAGTTERGPGWAASWATFGASRWTAAKCVYYEMDNEWATRSSGGIVPYWYQDAQESADWGTANFRNYVASVQGVTGFSSLPCFGASYSTGAASNPTTTFNPQIARFISGTGWASWPYSTDKNTNYGGVSIHPYGNSAGGPPSANTSRTVAQMLTDISTFRNQYGTNVATLRSDVTSGVKMAETEWWGLVANAFDSTSLAREAVGDIFGFIDHAANQATWNVHALALWGFGPGDTTNVSASPESIISTSSGKLVRRARYFVIRDMLAVFANTYPNIVVSSTDTGLALSGQNSDGTTGAILCLNLTSSTTTPTITPAAGTFTVTKTTKLPIPLTLDTGLTTSSGATIPSLAPLEAVLIEGTIGGSPISGPITPVLDAFTGIGSGTGLPTYSPKWGAGVAGTSNMAGTGSNSVKDPAAVGENRWTQAMTADSEVYATLATIPAGASDYFQIELRRNAAGTDLYYLEYAPSVHRLRVRQVKAGVDTNITPGTNFTTFTLANGDKLHLKVIGSGGTVTLQCFAFTGGSWQQAFGGDVTDSSAGRVTAAGTLGLGGGVAGNWVLDDFGGGSLAAPTNSVVPAVSGTVQVGSTLTSTAGTWDADDITVAYQWQRAGVNIVGATSSTYVLVDADDGSVIRSVVTATTSGGSTSANSAATAAVVEPAPTNSVAPALGGTNATVGQVITVDTGTWANMAGAGGSSFTYQWRDCATSVGTYADISGATSSSYTVASGEVTKFLKCVVTAHNTNGSAASATTVASNQVAAAVASVTVDQQQIAIIVAITNS